MKAAVVFYSGWRWRAKQDIELLGREALGELLQAQVETGRPDGKACWLLLLELCQLQGRQEAFEEIAIDYAVTFEVTTPSWRPSGWQRRSRSLPKRLSRVKGVATSIR